MSLTVVMPTYNGARFLRPQIESILAQTAPDFELLVMDDGSTDETVAIVDEFVRRDRRVRRLASTGNWGQRTRLRQLADAVSTEFLAIADQDDLWHPERNARLLDAIGDRAMAFGRSQLIDADGQDLGRTLLDALNLIPDAGPLQALFQPLVSAHAMIVRRDWIDPASFHAWVSFDRFMGLEALFSDGLTYVDDAVVFHRIHDANQCNGGVSGSPAPRRLVSLQRARLSLNFNRFQRLFFYMTMEELGRSAALSRDRARLFRNLSGAVYNAWYEPSNRKAARGGWLNRYLIEQLAPFAGSEADLHAFRHRLKSLTRPQLGLTNLGVAARRYLERPY